MMVSKPLFYCMLLEYEFVHGIVSAVQVMLNLVYP